MLKSQTINAKEGSKGTRERIFTIVLYSRVKIKKNGLNPGVSMLRWKLIVWVKREEQKFELYHASVMSTKKLFIVIKEQRKKKQKIIITLHVSNRLLSHLQ